MCAPSQADETLSGIENMSDRCQVWVAQLQIELANDFIHGAPLQKALQPATNMLSANAESKRS